jgi:hypothetical protein
VKDSREELNVRFRRAIEARALDEAARILDVGSEALGPDVADRRRLGHVLPA